MVKSVFNNKDLCINTVTTHPVERGILNFLVCLVVAEVNYKFHCSPDEELLSCALLEANFQCSLHP